MCAMLLMLTLAVSEPAATVYTISSGSGMPALMPGDTVVSLPYTDNRPPMRGDLAAYRNPSDPDVMNLHRIVGLPGETVQMVDGGLLIDGVVVAQTDIGAFVTPAGQLRRDEPANLLLETLPGDVSVEIIDTAPDGFLDNTGAVTVPRDHYFVMGDNRDNAADSRLGTVGPVAGDNMLGFVDRVACRAGG